MGAVGALEGGNGCSRLRLVGGSHTLLSPTLPPPDQCQLCPFPTLGGSKKTKVKNWKGALSNPIPFVKRSSEQFLFLL